MGSGFGFKTNADEILEKRRKFFKREMLDSILVTLPVETDTEGEWKEFEKKWGAREPSDIRPFPSNEEIFERETIGLKQRGRAEDDWLPVSYSILDIGESVVGAVFGQDITFYHRERQPAYSHAKPLMDNYDNISSVSFSEENKWLKRLLSVQNYFQKNANGNLAQHPMLTMDALNFAVELRGATAAYLDLNENPEELRRLMEIGLDFNIRFQEAQMKEIGRFRDGSFVWLGDWAPFEKAVPLSVDAYTICSVNTYAEFGYDYNRRFIEHFGHGFLHFHCNRADLAKEVARLPGLELFQFGGDTRDPVPEIDRLPEIRAAVGDIPVMTGCSLSEFRKRLSGRTLLPNTWYTVWAGGDSRLNIDEANKLMDTVRKYRR